MAQPPPSTATVSSILECLPRLRWRCLGWRDAWTLLVGAYNGWMADQAPRLGAALAFYTLLSMAPILVIIITIAGLAYGQQAAEGRLVWEIQGLVGRPGALVIQSLLKTTHGPGHGLVASAVGLATLFFGATTVVNELRNSLNNIWHVPPKRDQSTWQSLLDVLKYRFRSFLMVIGIGFMLMGVLILSAWLTAFDNTPGMFAMPSWFVQLLYSALSFAMITFLFALLFRFVPDIVLEWEDVLVGSLFTAALFSAGKYLIGLYLAKASIGTAYGAAGSLVAVLVWVYYSAQVFFFGAEFTCVYAHKYGALFRKRLALESEQAEVNKSEQHVITPGAPEHRPQAIIVPESVEEVKQRSV
jgi:membrane protein